MASTDDIRTLRERTGAGIMDCKRALDDANGDQSTAERLLKERGFASVAKKAGREANQGMIESYVHAGGRVGAMVELNCETDFVARTDEFRVLAHEIAMQVAAMAPSRVTADEPSADGAEGDVALLDQAFIREPSKTIRDRVNETIAKLGENIVVRRFSRYQLGEH